MRLMTAAEVAEYTRFDKRTIWRMARTGELPCRRLGRGVRFKLEEVDAAMKGGCECQKKENEVPKLPRV